MDLGIAMKAALAETWAWYFKAHSFHWNVRGPLFSQLHEFFGDIYEDAHDAVDAIAEHIRALDEDAPHSLDEIVGPAKIKFEPAEDSQAMVGQLLADNQLVIDALTEAQTAAEDAGKKGLANFMQDRLDRHAKWGWMLTSSMKGKEERKKMRSLYRGNRL